MVKQYNLYDELMKVIYDNNKSVVNIEYVSIRFDEDSTSRYVSFDLFAKVANKMREREEWCAPYVNPSLKVVFTDGSWIDRMTDWDEYEKWVYHEYTPKPEYELTDEKELEYQIFKYGTVHDINLKVMDALFKRRLTKKQNVDERETITNNLGTKGVIAQAWLDDEKEEDEFRHKIMAQLVESNPFYKRVIEDESLKKFFV